MHARGSGLITMESTPLSHPIESEYPKLVRDNIPDIIKARTGNDPERRIAENDQEFEAFLLKKIVEEAIELRDSAAHGNAEEELGDINELLHTLMKLKRITAERLDIVQREKREKNGGFEKRLIMLSKVAKPEEGH